jgi:predicted ester cyclase
MSTAENTRLAYKMIEMHAGHEDGWVDTCYHSDCEWIELPIGGQAKGRRGGIDTLKAAADDSCKVFPSISINVTNAVGDGNRVALEIDFEGTMAKKLGSDSRARVSKVKMAIFLTFAEGQIIRQVDYLIPLS